MQCQTCLDMCRYCLTTPAVRLKDSSPSDAGQMNLLSWLKLVGLCRLWRAWASYGKADGRHLSNTAQAHQLNAVVVV